MAQYGKNFYGSTYYGNTNAFSGIYETKPIFTDESLKGTFTVNINAILPDVYYDYNAGEIMQVSGAWTKNDSFRYMQSNSPSAELKFMATCDRVIIRYQQNNTSPTKVNVQIITSQPGLADTTTNYSFNPNSTTVDPDAQYVIDNLPYGMQQVRVYLESTNTATFQFKGIEARVTNFVVETRACVNVVDMSNAVWTPYTRVPLTKTARAGVIDGYSVTGTTVDYKDNNMIQVRIHLASSDNETTPKLEYLETIAGDSNNRTEDGWWEVIFDMQSVATASGKTFKEVTAVDWVATVPETTTLEIRSSSSTNNLAYGPISVPYRQNTKRLRLKKGFNNGYMDVPAISPGSAAYHTITLRWDSWDDQSYLPPDNVGCNVKYIVMDSSKNESNYTELIEKPMRIAKGNRNFYHSPIADGRDFFLRVRLERGANKATPVVDWIALKSWMQYKQEHHVKDYDSSPVDNNNTGEKYIAKLDDYTYNPPPEVDIPDYYLEDKTERPNDISIYYAFEKDSLSRTYVTNDRASKGYIWVKAETREIGEDKGIVKHYQYGGGTAKYPVTDETEMAPIFTPTLETGLKYRYFLESGWPTVYHTVQEGETLDSIATDYNKLRSEIDEVNPNPSFDNSNNLIVGQGIEIPNDTVNPDIALRWKTAGVVDNIFSLTDTSGHNAKLENAANLTSDKIQATVSNSSIYGEVDWTSGEKIYNGIVNQNNIRSPYVRKHNTPQSGDSADIKYTVLPGETYASIAKKFLQPADYSEIGKSNVYELDIRIANNARDDQEPVAGQVITIPSLITLPAIDPKAYVEDNPYEVSIIYNSVQKKDGTKLSEEIVIPEALFIEWQDVTVEGEEVIRGQVANGKDLLKNPRVKEIIKVTDANGMAFLKSVTAAGETSPGAYKLTDNCVDWSEPNSDIITEPLPGDKYYVTYTYEAPKTITITIDTTYQEEGGVDHIWRSPEVKEFSGMCYPGHDDKQELPPVTEWEGVNEDPYVEDIEYMVEDNDLWVKTWVQQEGDKYYVVGSLQDRVPKDNWFPTIQTGYYYLGDKEFYLYNEPIIIEPTEKEMPVAKNVWFSEGKYNNAVYLQEASTNLVRNSGFETLSDKSTVFKISFTN